MHEFELQQASKLNNRPNIPEMPDGFNYRTMTKNNGEVLVLVEIPDIDRLKIFIQAVGDVVVSRGWMKGDSDFIIQIYDDYLE